MSWTCLQPSYLLVSAQIISFISAALSGPGSVVGSFPEKQLVMEPSLHTIPLENRNFAIAKSCSSGNFNPKLITKT